LRARAKEARQQWLRDMKRSQDLAEQAAEHLRHAEELEKLAAKQEQEGASGQDITPLPAGQETATVVSMDTGFDTSGLSHALKVAYGKARNANDGLGMAAVRVGMTKGDVIERVRKELKLDKLSPSTISHAATGTRTIRRDVAEAIERLTGYKANKKNWPGGLRDVSRRTN
jgi:hypothetical protein